MIGKRLGHYEILERLGAGGMGEVYRARDTRLGREVAIKILPETAERDPQSLDRFQREAQAASALNHPNICTIHDVGEDAKRPFIVMEYVKGDTLDAIIQRGPIEAGRVIDLAVQIADALDAAHRQTIVHRDIKPGNIVVTERGIVKVLDFGLAKHFGVPVGALDRTITVSEQALLTSPGMAVGTVAYMSPEQALGRTVDARSDLFAFGAVLHEMATGKRAFPGRTPAEVFNALLNEPPANPLPEGLSGLRPILDSLLEKAPERRMDSAASAVAALRRLSHGDAAALAGGKAPASIAVLPFVNISADPENEYFTDGMSEEILSALSKVDALRVASRTSSFAFKGRNEDIRSIGRSLGVGSILEGSVRKSGKRLRVTVQLVKVEDGYRLWSERYDREMEDVFAVQDEIAESVANALRVVLTERERRMIRKVPTENIEAYDDFLRGRDQLHRLGAEALNAALELFERATVRDPRFALAWVGVVEACYWLNTWIKPDASLVAKAGKAAQTVLGIDPDLAEAHVAVGLSRFMSKDHAGAYRAFEKAIALDPHSFEAYYYCARTCVGDGRLEDAAAMFTKASEVRPEDYQTLALLITTYQGLNRPDDSRRVARMALDAIHKHLVLSPHDIRAVYMAAGAAWTLNQNREETLGWTRRAMEMDPNSPSVRYNVACTYVNMGMYDEALDLLEANVENGWGEKEWVEHDPDWFPLKDNPRFKTLLGRMRTA